ncbi:hypothetical protein JVT61DRAFT_12225 [Boletus reticuloceps]|uniref:Uncharacterized protein n=1 Tax=Boletus reticuloceps TaxID=495285 RepID=A0A8I3A3U3_9AGAM|nr:hypothetical protein JVT61DRAFT_12225 [Boletus reticuloceps]
MAQLFQGGLQGQGLSVDIPDIGGGASVLYVLHGGTRPSRPAVGHFAYQLSTISFELYNPSGWKNLTVADVESGVRHPEGLPSILDFTGGGIPFWSPTLDFQERLSCTFKTIQSLIAHFQNTFDPQEFNVHALPTVFSTTSEGFNQPDGSDALRRDEADARCPVFRPPESLEELGAHESHVLASEKRGSRYTDAATSTQDLPEQKSAREVQLERRDGY